MRIREPFAILSNFEFLHPSLIFSLSLGGCFAIVSVFTSIGSSFCLFGLVKCSNYFLEVPLFLNFFAGGNKTYLSIFLGL